MMQSERWGYKMNWRFRFLEGREISWTRAGGKITYGNGVFGVEQSPNVEGIE